MRPFLGLCGSLLVATLLLLHGIGGEASGDADAGSRAVEAAELRLEKEEACRGRETKYLKCLQRDSPRDRRHGVPHSMERQAYCDAAFADYLVTCYNPDSTRCRKRRKGFDKCMMNAGHSKKHGAPNSTTRMAFCKDKHWRYALGWMGG